MSILAGPDIVRDGLVLCLDAGSRKSYPGTGTVLNDLSGQNNHGTLTNGPIFNSSNGGNIVFDGVNDYITTPTISTQFLTTGLTFSIFLYYIPTTTNDNVICCGIGNFNGTGNGWELRFRGNNANAEFSPGRGAGGSGVPARLQAQSYTGLGWGNRLLCFDVTYVANGLAKMYENGNLISTRDYTGVGTSTQTNPIWIGRATDSYFPGNIYSVKVYNRALTLSEIRQNFNITRGRFNI